MLVASVTSSITDAVTSLIGDHGLYAVFLLMLVDAVLPAARELVMVYGGALAAGAFAGQDVVLFGERIDSPAWGFVAIASAGSLAYLAGPLRRRGGRWASPASGSFPPPGASSQSPPPARSLTSPARSAAGRSGPTAAAP